MDTTVSHITKAKRVQTPARKPQSTQADIISLRIQRHITSTDPRQKQSLETPTSLRNDAYLMRDNAMQSYFTKSSESAERHTEGIDSRLPRTDFWWIND